MKPNVNKDETENESTNIYTSIKDAFEEMNESIFFLKNHMQTMQSKLKTLEKNVKKQMKTMKREVTKTKTKQENHKKREPSGFAKPTKVTKELCIFMNKEEGSEIARTEVTKALSSYIKSNQLQNKENKKIIVPDEKLKFLLGLSDNEELTYFNLQKHMNKHFIKLDSHSTVALIE
jgi:chromatin remodeling complex protein RSC6